MNENEKLVKNAFKLICHILGIFFILLIIFLLGFRNYNDSRTIQQIKGITTELRKENYQLTNGFNFINRESEKREAINRELQKTVNQLEKDKKQYSEDLDRTYQELERTNQELDRIGREREERSREAITDSEEIRREIDSLGEIIEQIGKRNND